MSVHPEVELVCDAGGINTFQCLTRSIYDRNGARARITAREEGWLTAQPGGLDYCPEHRPDREATSG